MRDQLVGYLCGALDEHEHADVERNLADNPELRAELDLLRGAFEPLAIDAEHHAPPVGLAAKTCDAIFASCRATGSTGGRVSQSSSQSTLNTHVQPAKAAFSSGMGSFPRELVRRNWRMIDSAIALGAIAAAALLFFPALVQSRYLAQVDHCQANLATLGQSLTNYAQHGPENGYYPRIARHGNHAVAGIYGVRLLENGFLDSPKHLICPSSPLAARNKPFVVPTSATLAKATGEELREYQRTMGGSYGYALGFVQNGRYVPTQHRGVAWNPVLADALDPKDGQPNSCNHGGRGQNVLFENGAVGYFASCHVVDKAGDESIDDEDIFRNRRRDIAAGLGRFDFVLGDSASNPWTGHAEVTVPAFLIERAASPRER
jgi:hypothetical protein